MNNDETFEFENRVYVNPDISRDEQTAFVDTLRDLQAQKNAQIATETHNLGTDVEPHLGGLSGSEEYWQSKYQTPQVNAMVADMKAVAQQSALNNALQNYQNMLQNRYNQAYRAYQKRAYKYSTTPKTTDPSGGDGELPIDVNYGGGNVDLYKGGAGKIIPNTDYVSDYQDAETGDWYQLTSPRAIDANSLTNKYRWKAPSNGETATIGNRTFRYVSDTGMWYEQTPSAGPGTYSARSK